MVWMVSAVIVQESQSTPTGSTAPECGERCNEQERARAIQLTLEVSSPGTHRIYNLANGKGFSNRQVISTVEAVTGKLAPTEIKQRRDGDPAVLIASSRRAFEELGWKPERPDLRTMILDAWEYYQNILN